MNQLTVIVNVASFGNLPYFYYEYNVYKLPINVIGSTAILFPSGGV